MRYSERLQEKKTSSRKWKNEREAKMIMRKWCLLIGPTAIFGAVAVATTARSFFARDYERYLKKPKQAAAAR